MCMKEVKLYRKRMIPEECIELKDDEILRLDKELMVTHWKSLKPRVEFSEGFSCYFLEKGIKVSKRIKKDGSLYYWYCDIIKTDFKKEINAYVFTDLLADVIIMPDGMVQVVDLDELAVADKEGLITREELQMSLLQLNDLLEIIYSGRFDSLKTIIEEYEASYYAN